MNVLIVMPSRVQRTTSRSVSSNVRFVGGYENRGTGLPSSKWAVGSPSGIKRICLFFPRERDRRVRAGEEACCIFLPYTYSFQVRRRRSVRFSCVAYAHEPLVYRA